LTQKNQVPIGHYTEVTKKTPLEMRVGPVVTPTGQIDPTGHINQKEEVITTLEKGPDVRIGTPEATETTEEATARMVETVPTGETVRTMETGQIPETVRITETVLTETETVQREAGTIVIIVTIATMTEETKQTGLIVVIGGTTAIALQTLIGAIGRRILTVEIVPTDLIEATIQDREVVEAVFQEETHVPVEVVDRTRNREISEVEDPSNVVEADPSITVAVAAEEG
jgi:hypothetical protein